MNHPFVGVAVALIVLGLIVGFIPLAAIVASFQGLFASFGAPLPSLLCALGALAILGRGAWTLIARGGRR